jgi:hypothetical protein
LPYLRLFIATLSPRRPGFDARIINVKFVVERVALGLSEYLGLPLTVSFSE